MQVVLTFTWQFRHFPGWLFEHFLGFFLLYRLQLDGIATLRLNPRMQPKLAVSQA